MFTGIVEAIGTVQQIQELDYSETGGSGYSLIITECSDLLNDITLGDSIAVNGICLTATELTPSKDKSTALYASVKFQISPETLRLTNLIDLSVGSKVNLERAMKADQRLSGHMVQGHVDTTVTISAIEPDENTTRYTFRLRDKKFMTYIVHKGYVCLDGTSLTVVEVDMINAEFSVMLIQYTQQHVIMPLKKVGDSVNLEVDQVGKYVENLMVGMMTHNTVIQELIKNIVIKTMDEKKE